MMSIFECEVFLKIWVRRNYFESTHNVGSKHFKLSGKLKNVSNYWFDHVEIPAQLKFRKLECNNCSISGFPEYSYQASSCSDFTKTLGA